MERSYGGASVKAVHQSERLRCGPLKRQRGHAWTQRVLAAPVSSKRRLCDGWGLLGGGYQGGELGPGSTVQTCKVGHFEMFFRSVGSAVKRL